METPSVGDAVIIPYPYSNLSKVQNRPALVTASTAFGDIICCQITSAQHHPESIALHETDFITGGLARASMVRYSKLATMDPRIVRAIVGRVSSKKLHAVHSNMQRLFTA